ncbi:MAG: acetoin reductase [Limosilactobacillus sp.]
MANDNRVAVVTGSGRRIGKAIAEQLANDGYDVVVADLNIDNANAVASEISKNGHKAVAVQGDVSKKEAHEKFVKVAVDNFGRLDTYVNNAGIIFMKRFTDISEEDMNKIFSINVNGTLFGMQAAYAQFMKQDDGDKIRKIINASSVGGHFGAALGSAYSGTKFAIRGLTQSVAQEVAKDHITVNAYCPGIVDTPMWAQIDAELVGLLGGHKGQYLKQYSDSISLGRTEQPQDVANFVSYLASPKSDYMNGQAVQIDGGMTMI